MTHEGGGQGDVFECKRAVLLSADAILFLQMNTVMSSGIEIIHTHTHKHTHVARSVHVHRTQRNGRPTGDGLMEPTRVIVPLGGDCRRRRRRPRTSPRR